LMASNEFKDRELRCTIGRPAPGTSGLSRPITTSHFVRLAPGYSVAIMP